MGCVNQAPVSVLAGSGGGTPAGGLSCCPGSFCLAPALSLGSGCAWVGGGSPGASPPPGGPLTLPENGTFVRAPAQGSGPGFLKAPDRTCLLQLRPGLPEMPCMAPFLTSCQRKALPPAGQKWRFHRDCHENGGSCSSATRSLPPANCCHQGGGPVHLLKPQAGSESRRESPLATPQTVRPTW